MRLSRRSVAAVLCTVALGCSLLPATVFAASRPAVTVPSAIVMMRDGRVIWSRDPSASRRVASTIKMLNALVVRENAELDEVVTVSRKAAATPDGMGLVRGQRFTVRQLLAFMLVASANDAAEALAIHIAGSETAYVAMMNAKARRLGLKDTHAVDPHGLSKREHSTAQDLSVLARELMKDPELRSVVLLRKVRVRRPNGTYVTVAATNKLLGRYTGIEGVKTGFTNPAGYCLVSAAQRGRFELFGAVLGAQTLDGRFAQTRSLLDWGFAHVRWRRLVAQGEVCASATITSGTVATLPLYAAREASGAVVTAGSGITRTTIIPREIRAPIRKGQQLGVLTVAQAGVVLSHVALLASADVATAGVVPAAFARSALWTVPAAPSFVVGANSPS